MRACVCVCVIALSINPTILRDIISEETVVLDAEVATMDDIAYLVKSRCKDKLTEEQRNMVRTNDDFQ